MRRDEHGKEGEEAVSRWKEGEKSEEKGNRMK